MVITGMQIIITETVYFSSIIFGLDGRWVCNYNSILAGLVLLAAIHTESYFCGAGGGYIREFMLPIVLDSKLCFFAAGFLKLYKFCIT